MKTLMRVLVRSLILITTALPALADDKGTITGKVSDKKTGHALPFANVAVPTAQKGALTDSEGRFTISGVPVGTYELKIQFLGYKPETVPGVVVAAGKPSNGDVKLEESVVHEETAVALPVATTTPGRVSPE